MPEEILLRAITFISIFPLLRVSCTNRSRQLIRNAKSNTRPIRRAEFGSCFPFLGVKMPRCRAVPAYSSFVRMTRAFEIDLGDWYHLYACFQSQAGGANSAALYRSAETLDTFVLLLLTSIKSNFCRLKNSSLYRQLEAEPNNHISG